MRSYSDELAEAEAVALQIPCISVVDHRYQNIETSSLSALLEKLSGPLRIHYIGRTRFIHPVKWSSFGSYPNSCCSVVSREHTRPHDAAESPNIHKKVLGARWNFSVNFFSCEATHDTTSTDRNKDRERRHSHNRDSYSHGN